MVVSSIAHNVSGLCVVALSINLKLTTALYRAITQNPCYVPLIIGKMYKRKTKEKFFMGHQVGFNGKKEIMQWNFETEADCDKKLSELNAKQKASAFNLSVKDGSAGYSIILPPTTKAVLFLLPLL